MIIEEDAVEAFLEHHGVKGQKWGIRNTITFHGRTHVNNDRHQTRLARNGKRVVAALFGGPVGLVAYNSISAPLKKGTGSKKTQSEKAYIGKLIVTGILTSPLGAVGYAQIAAPRTKVPAKKK